MKPTPCPIGPAHQWKHSHDITLQTRPAQGVIRMEKRGVYECRCGAFKHGLPRGLPLFG